jgi:hypothetical protein
MKLYILEVQKFILQPLEEKGFIHIGYMNKVFKSKREAIEFYNNHNPRMRNIKAHGSGS